MLFQQRELVKKQKTKTKPTSILAFSIKLRAEALKGNFLCF